MSLAKLPPSDLARLLTLARLSDKAALRREDPLTYGFRPHPMQERIHASRSRYRIVVAANRVGKTVTGMRETLWCARGKHPYRRVKPDPGQIWIGAPDYPSYLRFHLPTFQAWCPPSWIVGNPPTESKKYVDIRRADSGICRIHFLSYDMPRSKWQGAGVDGIWPDEEMPEDLFGEAAARIVDRLGWMLLTFTPVDGIGWWHDRLWVPAIEGRNKWEAFPMALATRDPANPEEFEVGQPLVPHFTRDMVLDFASLYPDPDERAVRIFGDVVGRKGLIYKGFQRTIHLVPRFQLPAHYEVWGAVDPGYHGFAAVIGALSPQERLYIVQEFFSQQETLEVRFRELLRRIRPLKAPEAWRENPTVVLFLDTEDPQAVLELNVIAARVADQEQIEHADDSEWVQITLAFASLDQGLKARKAGYLRVQQILHPSKDRPTPDVVKRPRPRMGEPQAYVFDDLYSEWQAEDGFKRESRFVWEIERFGWKKPTTTQPHVQPDEEDRNTAHGAHMMAAFRYLTMSRVSGPEEPKEDLRSHLSQHDRQVWEDMEELEARLLEEAGMLD